MRQTFQKLPSDKQAAIYFAAARVFAQHGYHRANVADICRSAGISNGALYKYFTNKEDLFVSLFDFIVDTMRKELFLKHFRPGLPVFEQIANIFGELVAMGRRHPEMLSIFVDMGSCAMNPISKPYSEKIEKEARNFWLLLVKTAKQRGEIPDAIDDVDAAFHIDNHINLLAYSLVSEHFDTRMNVYYGKNRGDLTDQEKVARLLKSVRMIFT